MLPIDMRSIWYGLQNLWRWLPIIWADRDWDEAYLLRIMAFKFRAMERFHREHGQLMRADRTARQLQIAAKLCERMEDDDYSIEPKFMVRMGDRLVPQPAWSRLEQQDKDYLATLIRKHLYTWWD